MLYTTSQVAEMLGVSIRSVQRYCKRQGIITQRRKATIPQSTVDIWLDKIAEETQQKIRVVSNATASEKVQQKASVDATEGDSDTTDDRNLVEVPEGYVVEILTPEEKQKLEQIIHSNNEKAVELRVQNERIRDYQNQVEYLRSQQDRVQGQLDKVIETFKQQLRVLEQRQYIEAKEKRVDS